MSVLAKQCRACRRGVRWRWAAVAARWCSESPLRRLLAEASAHGEARAEPPPALRWATQPYAAAAPASRWEGTDPRDTTVLLFPGEESHRAGMGRRLRDLPAAKELYDLASDIVGWDVWRASTEGAGGEGAGRRAVSVLVTSLAGLERARAERPAALQRTRAVAGLGVGELAALTFAGSLTLEAALRLVELRAAAEGAEGGGRPRAALRVHLAPDATLAQALAAARAHATERGVAAPECRVAAYLYPGCKLVAGDPEAVQWLERHGGSYGVRRSERAAAGAGAGAGAVREGARAASVRAPRVRVMCGAEGRAYSGAGDAARGLAAAVAAPLRWEQTLHRLYARPRAAPLPLTLVLGPGSELRRTLRLVNARAWDNSLQILV